MADPLCPARHGVAGGGGLPPPGTRCRAEGGAPTWRRAGRAAVPSSPRGLLRRRRTPSCRQRGRAAPPPPTHTRSCGNRPARFPTCPGAAAAAMKAASGEQPAVAAEEAGSDVRGEAAGGGQPRERGGPPARRRGPPRRPSPIPARWGLLSPPTAPHSSPVAPRLPRPRAPRHGRGVGRALSGRDPPAAMRWPTPSSAPWRPPSVRTCPWRPPPWAALPWVVGHGAICWPWGDMVAVSPGVALAPVWESRLSALRPTSAPLLDLPTVVLS